MSWVIDFLGDFRTTYFLCYLANPVQNFSIAMVFAGAQHLYAFSLDDTSPIGSRAILWHIKNLPKTAIDALAKQAFPERVDAELVEVARFIWERSGGQAGLAAKLLEELASMSPPQVTVEVLLTAEATVSRDNRGLLENWSLSLTPRARAVARDFCENDQISLTTIAAVLRDAKLEPLLAPRVVEELQYMGIADELHEKLVRRNAIFWDYYERLKFEGAKISSAQEVWSLIETTELSMRDLIKKKYDAVFGRKAEEVMSTVIGEKAWAGIQETKAKSKNSYKYSREVVERDTMSCMYFGHLKDLMIHSRGWPHFKHMFRDKRELEDRVNAITPVRNDRAHFSEVPEKELDRCRIACDDLSVIVDRQLEELMQDGAELA
ncbi:MAG: hypothetical protein IPP41_07255 [Rhodocyclaceae bacterium]|nr:hypothetical protein [Rhodocyclaceae bacterium]